MTQSDEKVPSNQVLELNNDYKIDSPILQGDVVLAKISSLVILSIFTLSLTTVLFTFILDTYEIDLPLLNLVILSLIISISIYTIGGLGDLVWQRIGYWVASNTIKVYTNKFTSPIYRMIGSIYLRFAGKNNVIFLEGEALDANYRRVTARILFVFKIGITQLSFFLIFLTYFWGPIFQNIEFLRESVFPQFNQEFQIVLSVATSVGTMAWYLPATFILRDSNLRLWNTKKRLIGHPLMKIRNIIESFIGVGAILTGWEIYQTFTANREFLILNSVFPTLTASTFLTLIDYALLLIVIVIATAPIIFPAAVTYLFRHSQNVNRFRTYVILSGVEVGISKIREPAREEKDAIGDYINTYL